MKTAIKDIRLKFECPVKWEGMQEVQNGRFCSVCEKTVYDFTGSKPDYFRQVLAENGSSICGRFSAKQMAPANPTRFTWSKWLTAALVLLGINIVKNDALGQDNKPAAKQQKPVNSDKDAVFGLFIEMQPEFPGGMQAFQKFIMKKMKYPAEQNLHGKVFASFIIDRDGSITDIKINKGLTPEADQEVIRVLKLSPKWKPAIENGRAVKSLLTVPVAFGAN